MHTMEEGYAMRMVPRKVFESYTPVEISLRRATIENVAWVQQMDRLMIARTGRRITATRLDEVFSKFINAYFPIEVADVTRFECFVLTEEGRRPVERKQQLWWSSHPSGQEFGAYPLVDEPEEEDMLRRR